MLLGDLKSLCDLGGCLEVERDAFALLTVEWFDGHRRAYLCERRNGLLRRLDDFAPRHRDRGAAQQRFSHLLVRSNVYADGASAVGHSRLDKPAVLTIAELHKAVFVQAPPRDAALRRSFDKRLRAGAGFRTADQLPGLRQTFGGRFG